MLPEITSSRKPHNLLFEEEEKRVLTRGRGVASTIAQVGFDSRVLLSSIHGNLRPAPKVGPGRAEQPMEGSPTANIRRNRNNQQPHRQFSDDLPATMLPSALWVVPNVEKPPAATQSV